MGESQMHLPQSVLKNDRNTEVTTSRAGYGGVATGAICLGRWEVYLGCVLCWSGFVISVPEELVLVGAITLLGIWATLLFCPGPHHLKRAQR